MSASAKKMEIDDEFEFDFTDADNNLFVKQTASPLPDLGGDLDLDNYLPSVDNNTRLADYIPSAESLDLSPAIAPLFDELDISAIQSTNEFFDLPSLINNNAPPLHHRHNNHNNNDDILGQQSSSISATTSATDRTAKKKRENIIVKQTVEEMVVEEEDYIGERDDRTVQIENNDFCFEIEVESSCSIDDDDDDEEMVVATTSTAAATATTARKRGRPKKEDKRTEEQKAIDLKIKNGISATNYRKKTKRALLELLEQESKLIEKNKCLKRTVEQLESQISAIKSKIPANWLTTPHTSSRSSSISSSDSCDGTTDAVVVEHNYSCKYYP